MSKRLSLLPMLMVIVFLCEASFGSHLGNIDLSRMRQIYSEGTPGSLGYFRFLFDAASDNYFIEYVGEDENGNVITEVTLFEPTSKFDPVVSVSIVRAGTNFKYSYTLKNDNAAKQDYFTFKFQLTEQTKAPPFDVKDIPTNIPISNVSSPTNWTTSSNDIWFGWSNNQRTSKTYAVRPGTTRNGFSFESPFLPKVTRARFYGQTSSENISRSKKFPIEPSGDLMKAYRKFLQNDTNTFVERKTIASLVKPPEASDIICDTFILDLIGQVREAVAVGWIKHDLRKDRDDDDDHGKRKGDEKGKKKGHEKDDDEGDDNGDDDEMDDADKNLPGVAKSIIKKLTKVRRECLRGKFGSAREKLRALIKHVNAQRGKHLTEEAYALIKFNVEFLLEKI